MLVLSLFLTLWGIQGKGFTSGDSITYYDAARTSLTVIKWIVHGKNTPLSQYMVENNILRPESPWFSKPLHHILSTFMLGIFGEHDYVLMYMNTLFGILTVVIIFLLARELYNEKVALLSSFILATMGLFLALERTGMINVSSTFFLMLGIYLYYRDKKELNYWYLILTGTILGIALCLHPQTLPYIGAIFLYELYFFFFKNRNVKLFAKRIAIFLLPILILVFCVNGIFVLFKVAMRAEGINFYNQKAVSSRPFMTLFEQAFSFFHIVLVGRTDSTFVAPRPVLLEWLQEFVYDFWVFEGTLGFILIILGVLYIAQRAMRQKKQNDIFLLFVLFIPVVFYLFPFLSPGLRNLFPALPLMAICMGYFGVYLLEIVSKRVRLLGVVAISVFIILSLWNIKPLFSVHSGARATAEWLKKQGIKRVAAIDNHVMANSALESYGINVVLIRELEELKTHPDIKYLFINLRGSFFNPMGDMETGRLAISVVEKYKPVFEEEEVHHIHAMDFAKRRNNFLLDFIFKRFFGRNIKRNPMPTYLFDIEMLFQRNMFQLPR